MQEKSLYRSRIADTPVDALRGLNASAEARSQTLAQMALAWVLREGRVTSALIGASKPKQVVDCAGAIQNLEFYADELQRINTNATDRDLNMCAASSELAKSKAPDRPCEVDDRCAICRAKKCATHVLIIILSRTGSISGLFGGSALKPFYPSFILKFYTSFPRAATGIQATTWSPRMATK